MREISQSDVTGYTSTLEPMSLPSEITPGFCILNLKDYHTRMSLVELITPKALVSH